MRPYERATLCRTRTKTHTRPPFRQELVALNDEKTKLGEITVFYIFTRGPLITLLDPIWPSMSIDGTSRHIELITHAD